MMRHRGDKPVDLIASIPVLDDLKQEIGRMEHRPRSMFEIDRDGRPIVQFSIQWHAERAIDAVHAAGRERERRSI